jgi:hypothetical protein
MWRRVDLVWADGPPKRRFTQDLHGTTSQKMAFFLLSYSFHPFQQILTFLSTEKNYHIFWTSLSRNQNGRHEYCEDLSLKCKLFWNVRMIKNLIIIKVFSHSDLRLRCIGLGRWMWNADLIFVLSCCFCSAAFLFKISLWYGGNALLLILCELHLLYKFFQETIHCRTRLHCHLVASWGDDVSCGIQNKIGM